MATLTLPRTGQSGLRVIAGLFATVLLIELGWFAMAGGLEALVLRPETLAYGWGALLGLATAAGSWIAAGGASSARVLVLRTLLVLLPGAGHIRAEALAYGGRYVQLLVAAVALGWGLGAWGRYWRDRRAT